MTDKMFTKFDQWIDQFEKQNGKPDECQHLLLQHGYYAGYKARANESPWVPIADIPDEWKDGRSLLGGDLDGAMYELTIASVDEEDGQIYWSSNCGQYVCENPDPDFVRIAPTAPKE